MNRTLIFLAVVVFAFPQEAPRDHYGDPLPPGAVARFGTLRFRHVEDVTAVAFEPDGKTLMAVDYGSIHWWNVETGAAVRPPVKREGRSFSGAFSPDLKRIAAGEYRKPDGWIMGVYDSATGKAIRVIESGADFTGQPIGVSLSADGSFLAYSGTNGQAAVFDVATGTKVATLKGHEGHVMSVAYSPDGKFVATGGADKTIRFWNPKSGEATGRIDAPFSYYNLSISKDGARIAGGSSDDRGVRVWDVAGSKELYRVGNKDEVNFHPFFSGDGSELVVLAGGSTTLHDAASGREKRRITGGGYNGALSRDGLRFAAGGGPAVRLWDVKSGKALHEERPVVSGDHLWFSPDDATFKVFGSTIQTWETATGRLSSSVEVSKYFLRYGFSPDGRHYARTGSNRKIAIHASSDDREVGSVMIGNNVVVSALSVSRDAKRLAVGDENPSSVHVCDVDTGAELRTLADRRGGSTLAFSPSGELLAAEGSEGWIHVWHSATGDLKHSIRADKYNVGTLKFSPDSRTLIAAAQATGLRIWNAESGDHLAAMPSDGILGEPIMAVSADGRYLAGPHDDRQVKVYEAATGGEVMSIDPGRGYVRNLAFSNGGDRLAILTQDLNVLLWDVTVPGEARAAAKIEDLWDDLASKDAARAYAAVCALARRGGAVAAFLKERLIRRPPDASAIRKLVADLNHEDIETRGKAAQELASFDAVPEYRKLMDEKDCPAVVATALRNILSQGNAVRPEETERLRRFRAVTALGRGRSPEGTALLREVSETVTDLVMREEATRSLERVQTKK